MLKIVNIKKIPNIFGLVASFEVLSRASHERLTSRRQLMLVSINRKIVSVSQLLLPLYSGFSLNWMIRTI